MVKVLYRSCVHFGKSVKRCSTVILMKSFVLEREWWEGKERGGCRGRRGMRGEQEGMGCRRGQGSGGRGKDKEKKEVPFLDPLTSAVACCCLVTASSCKTFTLVAVM